MRLPLRGALLCLLSLAPLLPSDGLAQIEEGRRVNELIVEWSGGFGRIPDAHNPFEEWESRLITHRRADFLLFGAPPLEYVYRFTADGITIDIQFFWNDKYQFMRPPVQVRLVTPVDGQLSELQQQKVKELGFVTLHDITFGDSRDRVRGSYGSPDKLEKWPFNEQVVPPGSLTLLDFYREAGIGFQYVPDDARQARLGTIFLVPPKHVTLVAPMGWAVIKLGSHLSQK